MELIKTKMGRVGNNKKYENKLFLSIRRTRGTMTDATAKFLGIEDRAMIAFYREGAKTYISVAKFGDETESYKKVARVNGRFGVYTKSMVAAGDLKAGEYELDVPPVMKEGKEWYELKRIKEKVIKLKK